MAEQASDEFLQWAMRETVQRDFLVWARKQPLACMEALLAGKAAVMPIKVVPVVHGGDESYAPTRHETVLWAEKSLNARLDR